MSVCMHLPTNGMLDVRARFGKEEDIKYLQHELLVNRPPRINLKVPRVKGSARALLAILQSHKRLST